MKIVRVRIAVAINQKGQWNCSGWDSGNGIAKDSELAGNALEFLDGNRGDTERVYFVETDIPVPEHETVNVDSVSVTEAKL